MSAEQPLYPMILPVEEVIARYAAVARPMMLEFMERSSCISAAKLTCEVLRIFNLKAQVLPYAMVMQVPELKLAYLVGLRGEDKEKARRDAANWTERTHKQGGWDGHVVAIVEGRWLIDAAFDQVEMEGFRMPPMILVLDMGENKIPLCDRGIDVAAVNDDGLKFTLQYRPLDDWSFEQSDAWKDEGLPYLAAAIGDAMTPTEGER